MPELPEVETVCRSLRQTVLQQTIESVTVRLPRLLQQDEPDTFSKKLEGRRFCAVRRRGKYILLDLSDGETLVVHLRMTGKLLYLPASEPWGKHTHIVFALSDGHTLRYDDVRQFGTLQLTETAGCMGLSCLAALGPEPLEDDFTPQWLQQHMTGKKQKAKAFLLDQHNIAGIGNIYADEILFQAGIHPEEPVCKLADIATAERLWFAIRDRLSQGIAYGGSSIKDYVDSLGQSGSFQKLHKAYGRSGQPCVECGCLLEKMVSGGRSSVYCPNCQAKRQ